MINQMEYDKLKNAIIKIKKKLYTMVNSYKLKSTTIRNWFHWILSIDILISKKGIFSIIKMDLIFSNCVNLHYLKRPNTIFECF